MKPTSGSRDVRRAARAARAAKYSAGDKAQKKLSGRSAQSADKSSTKSNPYAKSKSSASQSKPFLWRPVQRVGAA